ncbi:MAG: MoxR family ATPase [Propionibacteriaceae bacterium]|jgi:MoxR-like ATPase|nr:MoxR family ATPase [Propionibacteriaceae bacterium]
MTDASPASEIARQSAAILQEVGRAVVGMDEPLNLAWATILAGGNILFEDVPGVGKTLAAASLATAIGLRFTRLQCTPDLLPGDITGSMIFDPRSQRFDFHPGPIFTGVLLADEINRTGPKTQSALLEAMAEHQVSIDGSSHPLPRPFHLIATANPVEYEGTYPLPEAQLDRFMTRLSVGYPRADQEVVVLSKRLARQAEANPVNQVIDAQQLIGLQKSVESIKVDQDILTYCVDLVRATRADPRVDVGASPRGSLALMLLGRAIAAIDGRSFVQPEDVKRVAQAGLAHRLVLTPLAWADGTAPSSIIADALERVPGPGVDR